MAVRDRRTERLQALPLEDLIAYLRNIGNEDPLHLRGGRDALRRSLGNLGHRQGQGLGSVGDMLSSLQHHFRGGSSDASMGNDLQEFLASNLRQNQVRQDRALQSGAGVIGDVAKALEGFFGKPDTGPSPNTPTDPNTGLPFGLRSPYGATPHTGDGEGEASGSAGSTDPIAALFEKAIRQTLRGGGTGAGGVIHALQNQRGVLQDQFGNARDQLLDHEQMATDDLDTLYGHLQNYYKRSQRQNARDIRKSIHQVNNQFGHQIDKYENQQAKTKAEVSAELARLGIEAPNQTMKLQGSGIISRTKSDRLDSVQGLRSDLVNSRRMSRQMRADAMMEGNVQTGQVHRDTTSAIGDLEAQLQNSLASLGTQIAQARASRPSLAERLQSVMGLQSAYNDYLNPDGGSGGDAPDARTTNMQDALEYLQQVGGNNAPFLQSLLNTAENYGTMTGEQNGVRTWEGLGRDPRLFHYQWSPDDIGMITKAFARGLGTKGIQTTPNLTYLQRALEIALNGTH